MSGPDNPVPPGLTEEAKEERERFLKANSLAREQIKKISLSILVFGQSPERNTALAVTRKDIHQALQTEGHNAMMPEEICEEESDEALVTKEGRQVQDADLVVYLVEDSPGALGETHDFAIDPVSGPKSLVMIPKKHEEGYLARGVLRLLEEAWGKPVYWYEDKEIETRSLCAVALKKANALRQIYYLRGGKRVV